MWGVARLFLAMAAAVVVALAPAQAGAHPDGVPRVAALAAPTLRAPARGLELPQMATTLQWTLPPGSTQVHLMVLPANNDGPGVNVIQDATATFVLLAPPTWYLLLPGMTYSWRVRATGKTTSVGESDLDWGAWSESWTFRTPAPDPAGVRPLSPVSGAPVATRTPTLQWASQDPALFYFEVQLSSDAGFDTDPATATAAVYQNLVHGGITSPPNSYTVPAAAALTAGATYSWRVRPRVQGDGRPTAWGPAASLTVADGTGPRPGAGNTVLPLFSRPFKDDFRIGQFFDHDLPFQWTDTNGYQMTPWGKRVWVGIDGHDGYDYDMPEGTPLLAVADGKVVSAAPEAPRSCPFFDHLVSGLVVNIEYPAGEGRPVTRSRYAHLSRIDVKAGQTVRRGEQIGLSGNTGCSSAPHVHFGTYRLVGQRYVKIDPYGWEGPYPDPWSAHPDGAASIWLWREGEAPPLYRQRAVAPNPNPTDTARVAITNVRWTGWRDEDTPNNEFVELTLDPRFAPSGSFDLTGYTIRNARGEAYAIPAGTIIKAGQPITVYSGAGIDTATGFYWGRTTEAWDDNGDCAQLVSPSGGRYRSRFGAGVCP